MGGGVISVGSLSPRAVVPGATPQISRGFPAEQEQQFQFIIQCELLKLHNQNQPWL